MTGPREQGVDNYLTLEYNEVEERDPNYEKEGMVNDEILFNV